MSAVDFPAFAREQYSIGLLDYVNTLLGSSRDMAGRAAELARSSAAAGVQNQVLMIDEQGLLGDPDPSRRAQSVDNHLRWWDVADAIGCRYMRVNAHSSGTDAEQLELCRDGISTLIDRGAARPSTLLIENHGGLSSRADWIVSLIDSLPASRCALMTDFNNFQYAPGQVYDRYLGVQQMMPFTRVVSAKSFDFDDAGNETTIDFTRMFDIIRNFALEGAVSAEYEGSRLSEFDGAGATVELLQQLAART
jgi:sugar phosphate isomerase/epimerase